MADQYLAHHVGRLGRTSAGKITKNSAKQYFSLLNDSRINEISIWSQASASVACAQRPTTSVEPRVRKDEALVSSPQRREDNTGE